MLFIRRLPAWMLIGVLLGCLTACTPSISPLYHDYRVPSGEQTDEEAALQDKIAQALQQADWTPTDGDAPNTVATEARTIRRWGLYRVTVYLEVAPIGEEYVRVFFHPYRKYFTGGRSKIPYLSKSLRRTLLPDLDESFRAVGLKVADERLDDKRRS